MDTSDILSILKQKKKLLIKMLELTKQFKVLLNADRIDDFENGIKNRQAIIEKISGLVSIERKLDAKGGGEINDLKKQIQDIIQEILKADKENAQLASNKIKWYKQQIKSINDNKKSANYSKNQEDAFYVDAKK